MIPHTSTNLPKCWLRLALHLDGRTGDQLLWLLLKHNTAFAVDEGERGDTYLVQVLVETGEATPKMQPVQRTPFDVREEVPEQLRKMQDQGKIQPSCNPWVSPVVLVHKKDSSVHFCINYCGLNTVTMTDLFPLPRIDDILNQEVCQHVGSCSWLLASVSTPRL